MISNFPIPGLSGLVMAGGQSKRMGVDKAQLSLGNGPSFLDLACKKIARLAPIWHVSCAKGKSRPGYPCLEDSFENLGPLAGIVKGLENAQEHCYQTLIVLACDLPLITVSLLANLVKIHLHNRNKPLLTVYQNSKNAILEMQAAIYSTRALPFFKNAIKINKLKLTSIIPKEDQHIVAYSSSFEPFFLNCNSPSDLEKAREFIIKKSKA